MTASALLNDVRTYYTDRLRQHGATPRGVDWNSAESQQLRFEQLLRVCGGDATPNPGVPRAAFVLGDYGCGYGALYEHLRQTGFAGAYRGFDISPAMLDAARSRFGADPGAQFGADEAVLADADYVVASGVFNVKLQTPLPDWEAYVRRTIDRIAALGRRGCAFNALTSYSDVDRMRPDLYYPNPCVLFDYCKRHFSRHVALLHDYGLYEFTIVVRR
jgi:SAM-dependent methyltransferase